ncbi:MAG TPA: 50S ribosomal protein L11 methyltransferase, partial [Elusimicrobiota bacterium]|nr:50S ribosomal protein L11 methyltransferase [Elusimicrobiota bacterium]
ALPDIDGGVYIRSAVKAVERWHNARPDNNDVTSYLKEVWERPAIGGTMDPAPGSVTRRPAGSKMNFIAHPFFVGPNTRVRLWSNHRGVWEATDARPLGDSPGRFVAAVEVARDFEFTFRYSQDAGKSWDSWTNLPHENGRVVVESEVQRSGAPVAVALAGERSSGPTFFEDESRARETVRQIAEALRSQPMPHTERFNQPFGGTPFGVEFWGAGSPSRSSRTELHVARIGTLVYVDRARFDRLPEAIRLAVRPHVILVENFAESTFAKDDKRRMHTVAALLDVLHTDMTGKWVIDAGAEDAMLSLAAMRQGATRAFLIDVAPDALEQGAINMEANGWMEREHFVVIPRDLRDPKAVLRAIGEIPAGQSVVMMTSIGHPARSDRWTGYTANNQTALALLDGLGGHVTDVLASGYEKTDEALTTDAADEALVRGRGLTRFSRFLVSFGGDTAVGWTASRMPAGASGFQPSRTLLGAALLFMFTPGQLALLSGISLAAWVIKKWLLPVAQPRAARWFQSARPLASAA